MLPVIRNPTWKAVAVILAVALWLAGASLLDPQDRWQRVGWHLAGGLTFFLLGLILPEYPKLRFLSRESALRLMAFLVFLTATELTLQFRTSLTSGNSLLRALAELAALLGSPFLSYFGALFLIRGLRAAPQYPAEVTQETARGDDPSKHPD